MNAITLEKLRELDLETPTSKSRLPFLSAASGLVIVNSIAYVVADDEQHLGVFPLTTNAPGKWTRMFEGDLPDDTAQRKKTKADLEVLILLPPFGAYRHNVLFAIGSGSKPNRQRGVLLPLDAQGVLVGAPRLIDLALLFAAIGRQVGELNIEGAAITSDILRLLQRGNKGAGINAVVSIPLDRVLQSLTDSDSVGELPFVLRQYDLGSIEGVPLGFTDGSALSDGRIVFTAVAEDAANAYEDGLCVGSAVGILAADGHLQKLEPLSPSAKVEGVEARIGDHGIQLYLVSDADDASVPAWLYIAEMS
jgi:hypothetical protein